MILTEEFIKKFNRGSPKYKCEINVRKTYFTKYFLIAISLEKA